MPRATVASRELKNKETGLDLFVPTFKEEKGLLSSTVHYQVVVVTNLPYFKTPGHKESDVVQCSCEKRWVDFEDLRVKLSEAFTGTVLPPLEKKSFMVNDQVLKERRNCLEAFLKFIATTSKLATSASVLQFLGVDALRANKAKQTDLKDVKKASETETKEDKEPDTNVFGEDEDPTDSTDLFDAEEAGDTQMFGPGEGGKDGATESFSMFEAPDLKPDIDEEDEKQLGLPDAITTKREKIVQVFGERQDEEEEKEKEELFRIEDDLDQLMILDVNKTDGKPSATSPKPATAVKPKANEKPKIASKPKPGVPPNKPSTVPTTSVTTQPAPAVEGMQQDDLLAYLQENLTSDADDVDLFS